MMSGQRIHPMRLAGRIVRDPLFAFLAVGVALFGGYQIVQRLEKPPILFTPEIEQAQVADFETLTGRKATATDRARLKADYIAEELLFREAIDRNMHLTDGETRKRLVDKVRYLIAGAPPEPSEEQLVNHYADHLDLYRAEPRTSFTQIFRQQEPADAALLRAQLNAGQAIGGDDFWLGRDFPRYGDSMVRGIFGQPFVDALKDAPEGRWIGPIQSPRGWHFVRKSERIASAMIPFPAIKDQVRQDYMIAHSNAAIEQAVGKLKEKFDVVED
ncbi:peptidylprolyl isomerase [Sphingobium sp. BYY-5]|uniref:peptidylprolyl isomerase n=1 Tax=Sphingobium sp. BYY-5 TaxID=2926400 RepID=UPI001FA767FE|nr:peptidylprolyl isomerase [Sphingobium sp. BYY-5]MCI4590013.1 peptidylprolyl isomerase [Sphingobium sp. BYY-5]